MLLNIIQLTCNVFKYSITTLVYIYMCYWCQWNYNANKTQFNISGNVIKCSKARLFLFYNYVLQTYKTHVCIVYFRGTQNQVKYTEEEGRVRWWIQYFSQLVTDGSMSQPQKEAGYVHH